MDEKTESRRREFMRNSDFKFTLIQCFTVDECNQIIKNLPNEYQSRHSAYKTNSITFNDVNVIRQLENKVFGLVKEFLPSDLYFLDLFVCKYDLETQAGLQAHTDGCVLSFTLQLNDPMEFEGGGTKFTKTQELFQLRQGELLLFRSKLEHEGVAITRGNRIILVGFIETKRRGILSKQVLYQKSQQL